MRRPGSHRAAAALGVSALLHGTCALLLTPHLPGPPRDPALRDEPFTVIFVPDEPRPPARAKPASPEPRTSAQAGASPPRTRPTASRQQADPEPEHTGPPGKNESTEDTPDRSDDAPLGPKDSERPNGPGEAAPTALALDIPAQNEAPSDPGPGDVPRSVTLVPRGMPAHEVPVSADAGFTGTGEERAAKQLVDATVRETLGRGRVERGIVHPYFGELGRALVARWDPERAVAEKGLSGFAVQARRGLGAYMKLWQQQAEAYGASGSPYGREEKLDPDAIPLVGNSDMQELAQQRRMRQRLREQSRESRRALVRVVQDRGGRLLSLELLRPSRDRALDRAALEDVRAAALLLPVPPAEALGGRDTLVSLWEFELIISITPPVPVVAFEFDLALKHFDARVPLDRRIYKRVRLVETN